jgi:S-disulfanyl-L-cysteine oxidoreductase SoxD
MKFLAFAALAVSPIVIWAAEQATVSVWDGVYTADQAKRGADLYGKSCASCHGDALEGEGQAPPLTGSEFMGNWNKQVVDDLLSIVKSTMPADKPGSLSRAADADILSYIFQTNGFPAGKTELPSDAESLKRIRIEAKK